MNVICFLVSCIFLCINLVIKKKKPMHPSILFFGMWSFIIGLSLMGKYNIYKPSDNAYILILLMFVFFELGSLINITSQITLRRKKIRRGGTVLNINVYYFCVYIALLFLCYDVFVLIKYLTAGVPLWQIRNWLLEEYGSNNPILANRSFIEEIIRTVFLYPVGLIMPPITAYVFFDSSKRQCKKKVLGLSIIYLILYSISGGGGRLRYIYFMGCFIIAYLSFGGERQWNHKFKKYRKYLICFCTLLIFAVAITTRIRVGMGYLFQQIYTYFALPPTLLSVWLPEIEKVNHTYGLLTLFGIHSYFFRALSMVGLGVFVPSKYYDAFEQLLNAQVFKNVGYGIGNAFVSPVYYFYVDGGIFGVCFFSFLFGIVANRLYKKFLKDINEKSFSSYALMMYGVFMTFQTIITALPSYFISFILLQFIFKKPTVKIEKEIS